MFKGSDDNMGCKERIAEERLVLVQVGMGARNSFENWQGKAVVRCDDRVSVRTVT